MYRKGRELWKKESRGQIGWALSPIEDSDGVWSNLAPLRQVSFHVPTPWEEERPLPPTPAESEAKLESRGGNSMPSKGALPVADGGVSSRHEHVGRK